MNLDEIQSLWSEDSKLDPDNLHTESTNIPALHAKYYRILNLRNKTGRRKTLKYYK